jgi:hypothetical protein
MRSPLVWFDVTASIRSQGLEPKAFSPVNPRTTTGHPQQTAANSLASSKPNQLFASWYALPSPCPPLLFRPFFATRRISANFLCPVQKARTLQQLWVTSSQPSGVASIPSFRVRFPLSPFPSRPVLATRGFPADLFLLLLFFSHRIFLHVRPLLPFLR